MFKKDRFKALIHYICASVDDPSKLGAIKLNKILWFSDVFTFAEFGEAVTGATYIKERFGPIPRAMLPTLRELVNEGKIRVDEVQYFGKTKRQFVSLVEPNLNGFSDDEKAVVDYCIKQITNGFTATSISELTHDDIWKLAETGEEIPFEAVLASDLKEVSTDDITWIIERNNAREAA